MLKDNYAEQKLICWTHINYKATEFRFNYNIRDIAVENDQICIIKEDQYTLECYSLEFENNNGKDMESIILDNPKPELLPTTCKNIDKLVSGYQHYCAYASYHAGRPLKHQFLRCQGNNDYNQLDVSEELLLYLNATDNTNLNTYKWSGLHANSEKRKKINDMYSGPYNTCVNIKHGHLICWGRVDYNLNNVPTEFVKNGEYVAFEDIKSYIVSIGIANICAIQNIHPDFGKTLLCWGTGIKDSMNDSSFDYRHQYGVNNFPEDIQYISHDVSVGYDHACALYSIYHYNIGSEDNSNNNNYSDRPYVNLGVKCWGSNHFGQLKVPYEFHSYTNTIASLQYYSCAINSNVYMACWGAAAGVVIPNDVLKYTRLISAGGRHSCMHTGGSVKCKGNNEFGQLDVGLFNTNNAYLVEAGWDYTCTGNKVNPFSARGRGGYSESEDRRTYYELHCIGFNYRGQTDTPRSLDNQYLIQASLGLAHSCAISKTDNVVSNSEISSVLTCWGGTNEYSELDIPLDFLNKVKGVAVADEHVCAYKHTLEPHINNLQQPSLIPFPFENDPIDGGGESEGQSTQTINNKVKCWGNNTQGQTEVPDRVHSLNLSLLTAGDAHTCTIVSALNHFSRQGLHINTQLQPSNSLLQQPTQTNSLHYEYSNELSNNPTLTLTNNMLFQHLNYGDRLNSIVCWGSDSQGQISVPGGFGELEVVSVVAGTAHTCSLTRDALVCWGSQYQSGIRDPQPSDLIGLGHSQYIMLLSAGYEHDCVVTSDGKPYCWGGNEYGQAEVE